MAEKLIENEDKSKEKNPAEKGQEVADLLEHLFDQVPSSLAVHLVESNVVLTLAGLKGQTEFYINISSREEVDEITEDVQKLNELFKKEYSSVFLNPHILMGPKASNEKMWSVNIDIYNADALRSISEKTKTPGIIPFNKPDDIENFEYLRRWTLEIFDNLEKLQREGKISADSDLTSLMTGLKKGYPDQALIDYDDWLKRGGLDSDIELQDSEIPFTGTYDEAQPNYDFYPEHAENPAIKQNIFEAGEILRGFYESEWHKKISNDSQFLKVREEEEKKEFQNE